MNIKTNKTAETLAIQSEEQMKKDKRAKFIELGEKRMAKLDPDSWHVAS